MDIDETNLSIDPIAIPFFLNPLDYTPHCLSSLPVIASMKKLQKRKHLSHLIACRPNPTAQVMYDLVIRI